MQLFRDAIDECGFMDLGFTSSQFTWKKHFNDGHSVWERLDRGLATREWMLKFAGTIVHHLPSFTSDHNPIWIVPRDMIFFNCNQTFQVRRNVAGRERVHGYYSSCLGQVGFYRPGY